MWTPNGIDVYCYIFQDSVSVVTSRFNDGCEVVRCVLDFYKVVNCRQVCKLFLS